jgi:hypothetical protein
MATRHGNKSYFQILLDPNRADLVMQLSDQAGVKPTAWIRDALYEVLKRKLPSSVYDEALAKDEVTWRETVRKRVEGRLKNRKDSKESTEA